MTVSAADWSELQETIAGEVVLPDAPEYDAVRKPAMFRFHDVRLPSSDATQTQTSAT